MPNYCLLQVDVTCPHCDATLITPFAFQWGRVPHEYRIGDAIQWQRFRSGEIVPSWRYVRGHRRDFFNCGDPCVLNAIVLDCDIYDANMHPRCADCHRSFDGVAIEIRDGRIADCRILKRGELREMIGHSEMWPDIIEISEDGSMIPKPEWYDHTIN